MDIRINRKLDADILVFDGRDGGLRRHSAGDDARNRIGRGEQDRDLVADIDLGQLVIHNAKSRIGQSFGIRFRAQKVEEYARRQGKEVTRGIQSRELPPVEERPREADVGHRLRRKVALVARVMHRQDDAHPPVSHVPREERPQINGRQRRVPVVRMHNDGIRAGDAWNRGQRRHAEACITTRVVRIVRPGRTVEIGSIEIFGALDEIDFRSHARIVRTLREAP